VNLRSIDLEIKKAMEQIAIDFGINFEKTAGTFSDGSYNFKSTFTTKTKSVKAISFDKDVAKMLGLPVDIVGKSFVCQGLFLTVTELKFNRPKFPVIASCNGKSYKLPVATVLNCLGNEF